MFVCASSRDLVLAAIRAVAPCQVMLCWTVFTCNRFAWRMRSCSDVAESHPLAAHSIGRDATLVRDCACGASDTHEFIQWERALQTEVEVAPRCGPRRCKLTIPAGLHPTKGANKCASAPPLVLDPRCRARSHRQPTQRENRGLARSSVGATRMSAPAPRSTPRVRAMLWSIWSQAPVARING